MDVAAADTMQEEFKAQSIGEQNFIDTDQVLRLIMFDGHFTLKLYYYNYKSFQNCSIKKNTLGFEKKNLFF